MADLIERFLDGKSRFPQEWNDFVDSSQRDKKMDLFRKRCYELDPLINRPDAPDAEAVVEARTIVNELRNTYRATAPCRPEQVHSFGASWIALTMMVSRRVTLYRLRRKKGQVTNPRLAMLATKELQFP
jgi:hypothetical protein